MTIKPFIKLIDVLDIAANTITDEPSEDIAKLRLDIQQSENIKCDNGHNISTQERDQLYRLVSNLEDNFQ